MTGSRRSNWVNWKGEERSCEGEDALVDSGLALSSAWPGLPDGKTAAQGEIFLRWCRESVASSVENGEVFRFDSDQQGIGRGVCLAQDGPRTMLRPGWRAASQSQCGAGAGAMQCGGRWGGSREGEKQGARRALLLLLLGAADETAWGRRLVAVAGLRVLGTWLRSCSCGCSAVRCSAAQRKKHAGWGAGGSRN